jgi:hypothetical protein
MGFLSVVQPGSHCARDSFKASSLTARQESSGCRHMADAGVIEALLPMLQSADGDTRDAVAVALAHIASHAQARRRVWSAGAMSPLVKGLSTLGFRGVEGAAVCLEKLVALKEAAEQLATEPVCQYFCISPAVDAVWSLSSPAPNQPRGMSMQCAGCL